MTDRIISALPHLVENLSPEEHEIWGRIYTISRHEGRLILPEALREEEAKYAPFRSQQITRVTNLHSGESTLFNELRAKRPLEARRDEVPVRELEAGNGCPFCDPLKTTPSDVFGRVEGRFCLTASNLAKYDALHALVIFRQHHPFICEEEKIRDFLDVAQTWFLRAQQYDPRARYPFFMWNCLWRAGASIIHGHAQALLAVEPYQSVEDWLHTCDSYRKRFGSGYGEDLFRLHEALGLGRSYREGGILACLTPVKEKEMMILAPAVENLPPLISRVLSLYHRLGVCSFNLAIFQPPLNVSGPVMARVVDRGDLLSRSSDIGGMELYGGTAVVSSDPFVMMDALAAQNSEG
ncbi:MAG: hypothetical protein LUO93_05210 [Methanomicrobiales archaeon]|nr:hypothetical protein [Methanomicrobiales archaeon]